MWWVVVLAAAVASGAGAAAAPAHDSLPPLDLVQIDQRPPDDDTDNWLASLVARDDGGASAPWLYFVDMPRDSQAAWAKRRMPSLSIDLPMSVLRQKLSLDKERRFHAIRAAANRDYLDTIGKRGFQWTPTSESGNIYDTAPN